MANVGVRQVRKAYGRTEVLHGVDIDIADGQFAVIVGPSGCGKSTLLRMIAGLEDISSGEIQIDGTRVNEIEPRERGCAMVFQNYALYPHFTVAQNIAYPLRVAGTAREERQRRVADVAQLLGIYDLLDRKPSQLSGGQRQRVAMGRAIVRQPKVFLFDEPLSNLDAKLRVQMRIEIRRIHERLAATSIFVTHDQIEAMTLADQLVVMNAGRIEQVGPPGEVYRRPDSAFVAAFLGAPPMNLLQAQVTGANSIVVADGEASVTLPGAGDAPTDTILLGIRPEDIRVSRQEGDGFPAVVEIVEELGGGRIAYCRMAGKEIAVSLPAGTEKIVGATFWLTFPPDRLHSFDARSGQRIEARNVAVAA